MSEIKIAFVGNYQYNCGSSNALLGYVRAGKAINCDVRVSDFGHVDKIIRKTIPVADKTWRPDLLVIVYESYPFLSEAEIGRICSSTPRSKRILIDPDGKYCQPISHSGDTNHSTNESYKYWKDLYDSLSDTILQPFLGENKTKKVYQFLYFGVDNSVSDFPERQKNFDLLYVGNNWYRWHDIKWIVEVVASIRSRLKKVALIGQYWLGDVMDEFKEATYSDPDFLRRNKIEVFEPAPYGQVEEAMGSGLLNPIFIRPILNKLEFVTPRMFETIMADSVPLIPYYFNYAKNLFGDEIKKLILSCEHASGDILRILDNYDQNRNIVRNIRRVFMKKHSYEQRLKQLLQYI